MSNFVSAGVDAEKNLVRELNKNKQDPRWKILEILNSTDHFAIRVNKKVFSKMTNSKANPKADVYVACGAIPQSLLKEKNFFLTDNDVEKYSLLQIPNTGISIKRSDSKSYTIHKWTPDSFQKTFGSYELGAGVSIFRQREEELEKNNKLLIGWKTSWPSFEKYFSEISDVEFLKDSQVDGEQRKKIAKKISEYSIKIVIEKIDNDKNVQNRVFQGSIDFDEPYNATWFYSNQTLSKAEKIPFSVTTGSGRTKGDYTVVVKPR
jgi:hypothetical protein